MMKASRQECDHMEERQAHPDGHHDTEVPHLCERRHGEGNESRRRTTQRPAAP